MRGYAPASLEILVALREGQEVTLPFVVAVSEDEQDEFDAMATAAQMGTVVLAADIDAADQAVRLDRVASFHVDVDDSGDLAWYATQELDQVVELLSR